jgi:flagellar protein FliO/FliZ
MASAIGLTTHVSVTLAASEPSSEKTPLHLSAPSGGKASIAGSSGGGLLRTIIGLVVVVIVIFAVSKVLRYIKASKVGRSSGNGLQSVASLPLGNNRAVHVVRVGSDILLLGSSEQQVSQLARYTEDEARERGLLETASARKPLNATLRSAAARTAGMRATPVVHVTPEDASPVAVTRNGSPVQGGGTGGVVGTMIDQLRARTVRR